MKVDELASQYANINGECIDSPCTGLTFDALPEVQKPTKAENSDTGVSTNNVLSAKKNSSKSQPQTDNSHWYALRTTYGREKKAYEYIISKGGVTFYPTLTTIKLIDGKRKAVDESCLPNIFFAYGTEEEIKSFVYDNVNFLSFVFTIATTISATRSKRNLLLFQIIKLRLSVLFVMLMRMISLCLSMKCRSFKKGNRFV